MCLSSSLVRIVEDLKEKSILFQEAALLNTAEIGEGGLWIFPSLSFLRSLSAVSVLRDMICSSLSLEKSAIEMEKYILSVSLNPAITED